MNAGITHRRSAVQFWTAAAGAALIAVLDLTASAGVIPDTQIQWTYVSAIPGYSFPGYAVTVDQVATGYDPTNVFFRFSGTTLTTANWALDEGSGWYLVSAGDIVSADTIAANQFTVVFDNETPPEPVVAIPFGNFYLGMSTYSGFAPGVSVFGWLELNNTGTELIAVANAVDYGDGGIIVGTTTPAPEPASLLVLAGGVGVLAMRRRGGRLR